MKSEDPDATPRDDGAPATPGPPTTAVGATPPPLTTARLPDDLAGLGPSDLAFVAKALAQPPPPRSVGPVEILGELGRGGMGVVYLARQSMGREVAVKLLRAEGDELRARFRREARAAARLDHPNVVKVFDSGEDRGHLFLVMEYVPGGTLTRALAGKPQDPRRAAALVEAVARGVDHAHREGVVHRDLKPANVLMAADGTPKVADFGLAMWFDDRDDHSALTVDGRLLGTPAYMAPEQAEGARDRVGPAADVFSLGAILYEALTGHPYQGGTPMETLRRALDAEIDHPSRFLPDLPRDLETVCLKCLEREPGRRYAGAGDLADDLRRFLDGRPIAARPVGPAERLARWGRRNPKLAALSAALALVVALSTPTFVVLYLRARRDRNEARTALTTAETEADRARRARDRALASAQSFLLTDLDSPVFQLDEMRPYRREILDRAAGECRAIIRELEGDPRAVYQLAMARSDLAKVFLAAGDGASALESAREALRMAEEVDARLRSFESRRGLAQAHTIVASCLPPGEQRAEHRRAAAVVEALVKDSPGRRDECENLLSGYYYNIALTYYNQPPRDFAAALAWVDKAVALSDGLFARGDRSRWTCAGRMRNREFQSEVLSLLGRHREAVDAGALSVRAARELYERFPDDFGAAWDLATKLKHQAGAVQPTGGWDEAVALYEEARAVLRGLAARDHDRLVARAAQAEEELAAVDYNLMVALGARGEEVEIRNSARIRKLNEEIYAICDRLALVKRLNPSNRPMFPWACLAVADYREDDGGPADLDLYRKAERLAEADLHEYPERPDAAAQLIIAWLKIADELARRGRAVEARRYLALPAARLRGLPGRGTTQNLFYRLAVEYYAANSRNVGRSPTRMTPRQLRARRREFEGHVIPLLRAAVDDGFRDAERLRTEKGLDPFRGRPGFPALLDDAAVPDDPFARP